MKPSVMTDPSFKKASCEKLIQLLQGKFPLQRNSYYVIEEKLEEFTSDFFAEVSHNCYVSESYQQKIYFQWLTKSLSDLEFSYDSDLFEEQLMNYEECYDGFPRFTNRVLVGLLDIDLYRLEPASDCPEERASVQATRMLQQIFVRYLFNRNLKVIKRRVKDFFPDLPTPNEPGSECSAGGSLGGQLPVVRQMQSCLFDHLYSATDDLVQEIRTIPVPSELHGMLEERRRKTDRLGIRIKDEIEDNLQRLPNEKVSFYLQGLKDKTEAILIAFKRQEFLAPVIRETKPAMERIEVVARYKACKTAFLEDLLSYIGKKMELLSIVTLAKDSAASGKELTINEIIWMLDHSGILKCLEEQSDLKVHVLLAILFNKNVDNFKKKLREFNKAEGKNKTPHSQEEEDRTYSWFQSTLKGKRKE